MAIMPWPPRNNGNLSTAIIAGDVRLLGLDCFVLLHSRLFHACDDLWGGQFWLPPAFEPALCGWIALWGRSFDLRRLLEPPGLVLIKLRQAARGAAAGQGPAPHFKLRETWCRKVLSISFVTQVSVHPVH